MATDRRCRECTLCCKLVPVRELAKPAGVRCQYQSSKGCAVYRGPKFPFSCGAWSCAWLQNDDMDDVPRPDRLHVVVDPSPEYVELKHPDGEIWRLPAVQMWVDPKHREAHRDPKLRAWIERRAQRTGQAAIVRFNSFDAILLVPPHLSADGEWHEKSGTPSREHTVVEVAETYAALRQQQSS